MPKVEDPHAKDIAENQMVQTQEIHCAKCGRFLGFQAIVWGLVKLPCTNSKCRGVDGGKTWVTIDISPEK